jgi:hypothetical protein
MMPDVFRIAVVLADLMLSVIGEHGVGMTPARRPIDDAQGVIAILLHKKQTRSRGRIGKEQVLIRAVLSDVIPDIS